MYRAIVIVLLALVAALAVAVVPRFFGYETVVVGGGSMTDTAPNGSLVVARWRAAREVQLGDVIVVREADGGGQALPKIHRVISLEEHNGQILVRTKGDANQTPDPKVYILPERVLTRIYTLPHVGYLVSFVGTPLGWALAVMLPATLLCAFTVWGIWRPRSQERHSLGAQRWAG